MYNVKYNILVADDDADIREGLAGSIRGAFGDRVRVREAANGLEAVELACGVHIDVIVADIKMPVCGGIEMMRRLAGLGYQGEIVVVSGFDDYTFVRQAMKLGAEDYILKPVDEKELTALLESCLHRVELKQGGRRAGMRAPERMDKLLLEQQYHLKRLLEGGEWPLPAEHGSRLLAVALNHNGRGRMLEEEERAALFLDMEGAAADAMGPGVCQLVQGETGALWGLALLADRDTLTRGAPKLAARLVQAGRRFGLSKPAPASQLPGAWREAVALLECHFYDLPPLMEPDRTFPFEDVQRAIVEALCACEAAACTERLHAFFGLLCYRKAPVEQVRQALAGLVYETMKRDSGYITIIARHKFTDHDIIQAVQDTASASVMRGKMAAILDLYIEEREELRKRTASAPGSEDYTVQKVCRLIEEGYRSDISLSAISEKLGLHPNYLSTLFRQRTGRTYGQYLRGTRIRRAIQLMGESNLKLYAVAEQVGYKDNAHFYRAFKEETGLSPAQYKKQSGSRAGVKEDNYAL